MGPQSLPSTMLCHFAQDTTRQTCARLPARARLWGPPRLRSAEEPPAPGPRLPHASRSPRSRCSLPLSHSCPKCMALWSGRGSGERAAQPTQNTLIRSLITWWRLGKYPQAGRGSQPWARGAPGPSCAWGRQTLEAAASEAKPHSFSHREAASEMAELMLKSSAREVPRSLWEGSGCEVPACRAAAHGAGDRLRSAEPRQVVGDHEKKKSTFKSWKWGEPLVPGASSSDAGTACAGRASRLARQRQHHSSWPAQGSVCHQPRFYFCKMAIFKQQP